MPQWHLTQCPTLNSRLLFQCLHFFFHCSCKLPTSQLLNHKPLESVMVSLHPQPLMFSPRSPSPIYFTVGSGNTHFERASLLQCNWSIRGQFTRTHTVHLCEALSINNIRSTQEATPSWTELCTNAQNAHIQTYTATWTTTCATSHALHLVTVSGFIELSFHHFIVILNLQPFSCSFPSKLQVSSR